MERREFRLAERSSRAAARLAARLMRARPPRWFEAVGDSSLELMSETRRARLVKKWSDLPPR